MNANAHRITVSAAQNDRNYLGCDIIGCTDVLAINYNPIAIIDDNS